MGDSESMDSRGLALGACLALCLAAAYSVAPAEHAVQEIGEEGAVYNPEVEHAKDRCNEATSSRAAVCSIHGESSAACVAVTAALQGHLEKWGCGMLGEAVDPLSQQNSDSFQQHIE